MSWVSRAIGAMAILSALLAVAQSPSRDAPLGEARWIAAGPDGESIAGKPMPMFRKSFAVRGPVRRATLKISGMGQFEAHVNGKNVTANVLTPGWSDYRKRVYFDTYDVTALLRPGENALGVLLGNGMYNVEKTEGRYTKLVGSFGRPKLIAELRVEYADGTQEIIDSNTQWRWAAGPIVFSSTYGGEDYDARREQHEWDAPGFADKDWNAAAEVSGPGGELVPETIPPVVENERYTPVGVTHPAPDVTVYDLGQNMAGWPEIAVKGAAGSTVRLVAGELLDETGRVTQKSANANPTRAVLFTYTLRGNGEERWRPRFTYYGFRYVEVQAAPAAAGGELPKMQEMSGRFLHDAVATDGSFHTSSELFNRIHVLIDRAMLSNMVSVLTDCPHREKLGWLEQTHLAGPSLMYNFGLSSLYAKMASDMRDAQQPDGLVPDIAPEYVVFKGAFRDSPEWGVAAVLSPWTAYTFYGDAELLRTNYPMMQRYVAYLKSKANGNILEFGLGDWYDIGPKLPGVSQLTSMGVTSTAVYYQALATMVKIAGLLGHSEDAAMYRDLAAQVKQSFNTRFLHADTNQYDTGSQTANAIPLVVGLVPDERRAAVLANLVADIRTHQNHVTAGDIGFHYVVRALTDGGRSDVLFDMLSRTDSPSYGYQLARGATTLTEAWDAAPRASQNHFMLGHAEEWFYRGLAGIDFDMSRPADERIRIAPAVVGDMESASASYKSVLGTIQSGWIRKGNSLEMNVSVPAGAKATVAFPEGFRGSVLLDRKPLAKDARVRQDGTQYVIVSGTYRFTLRR